MSMKIDGGMPNRISMNVSVGKQTQGATFGERVNAGLQQAGAAVASGAALVGGVIPGAGIVSAAVSSVTNLSNMPGGAAASAGYAATGVVNLGSGGGGMSTTVGGGGGAVTSGTTSGPNLSSGLASNDVGMANNSIAEMSRQNAQMMQVQIAMQRENQVFTSVSNVLKTKHDTVKNSISNIR
ncbi:MAG: hypothetical protein AB1938_21280 [Myxococcota bacterium]